MTSYEDSIIHHNREQWNRIARPPAWTSSRDALCESTDWFKSRQGGVYTLGGELKWVYINGYPSARAYMEADIIVTSLHDVKTAIRVATTGEEDGTLIPSRRRAARAAKDAKSLVGLIVGIEASTSDEAPFSYLHA